MNGGQSNRRMNWMRVLATGAAVAVLGTPVLAQEPTKRAGEEMKKQPGAMAGQGQDQSVAGLARAHQQFRQEVERNLRQAVDGAEQRVDLEKTTIASVADRVVVAGAPVGAGSMGMDSGATSGGRDRGDATGRESGTGTEEEGGDTGGMTGGRTRTLPGETGAAGADAKTLGVVMISKGDAGATGSSSRTTTSRTGVGETGNENENDAGNEDGAAGGLRRPQGLSLDTMGIDSGVYKVKADGIRVQLWDEGGKLAATVPLIKIDKPGGIAKAPGRAGTSSSSGGLGENDGATRTDEVGKRMDHGQQADWDTVFASIVFALGPTEGA